MSLELSFTHFSLSFPVVAVFIYLYKAVWYLCIFLYGYLLCINYNLQRNYQTHFKILQLCLDSYYDM